MSNKTQQPKGKIAPKKRELNRLIACANAQDRLSRARDEASKAEAARRQAITEAFANGHSVAEIAASIQVSRAKVYQLLGGAMTQRRTGEM